MDSLVDRGPASAEPVVPRGAIESLAGPVSAAQWGALEEYATLLAVSARRLSLISRSAEQQIGLHLVDSAAFVRVALSSESGDPAVRELADLGTGAGLPGAVVAILRPRLRVTLVDSRNSRIVFLKQVVRRLGLENVEILHSRLEALVGRRGFELAASRALGSLGETLAPSLKVLAPGGKLVLFKGPRWVEEEAEARSVASACGCELGRVEKVELPGYGRATWFVEFHVKRSDGEHTGPSEKRSES